MNARPPDWSFLVTAEHSGNDVPKEYRPLLRNHREMLDSHRGWDPGTRLLAESIASALGVPAFTSSVTRLLVDLNRSVHNPKVFSSITRPLPRRDRVALLDGYHRPHWDRARQTVSRGIAESGRVLHLGIHSFTPVLDGKVRRPDLALLYDPSRPEERQLATAWTEALAEASPDKIVRRNNPYLGTADGMTTAFRRLFPDQRYLGIEIEVNQRHVGDDGSFPPWVAGALLATLPAALEQ